MAFQAIVRLQIDFLSFSSATRLAERGNCFREAARRSLQLSALASTLAAEVLLSNALAVVWIDSQHDEQGTVEERRHHGAGLHGQRPLLDADNLRPEGVKAVHVAALKGRERERRRKLPQREAHHENAARPAKAESSLRCQHANELHRSHRS